MKTAEYLFPLAKIAYPQNLKIYPALIPRVSPTENFFMRVNTRQQMNFGNFDESSLYVFQPAEFIINEITERDRIIAINTMPKGSRAGEMNGVFVIVPGFENCSSLFWNCEKKLNIQKQFMFEAGRNLIFQVESPNLKNLVNGWA